MRESLKSIVKPMIPAGVLKARARLNALRSEYRIRRSSDRAVFKRFILPRVRARAHDLLWVGCREYAREYPSLLETASATCWTLESDPGIARFGHPTRHIVGSLLRLEDYFAPGTFDCVFCNGVFGYGIDSTEAQTEAISQMARSLRPAGILILGWNTDIIADPMSLFLPHFVSADVLGLGSRLKIPASTHVYDFCVVTKI